MGSGGGRLGVCISISISHLVHAASILALAATRLVSLIESRQDRPQTHLVRARTPPTRSIQALGPRFDAVDLFACKSFNPLPIRGCQHSPHLHANNCPYYRPSGDTIIIALSTLYICNPVAYSNTLCRTEIPSASSSDPLHHNPHLRTERSWCRHRRRLPQNCAVR